MKFKPLGEHWSTGRSREQPLGHSVTRHRQEKPQTAEVVAIGRVRTLR